MKREIHCSFCRRSAKVAGSLIRGIGCYICRDCAEFCIKIFDLEADAVMYKPKK